MVRKNIAQYSNKSYGAVVCIVIAGSTWLDRDPDILPGLWASELLHKDLRGRSEGGHQTPVCGPDPQGCQGQQAGLTEQTLKCQPDDFRKTDTQSFQM